jgi:hypothetical protein
MEELMLVHSDVSRRRRTNSCKDLFFASYITLFVATASSSPSIAGESGYSHGPWTASISSDVLFVHLCLEIGYENRPQNLLWIKFIKTTTNIKSRFAQPTEPSYSDHHSNHENNPKIMHPFNLLSAIVTKNIDSRFKRESMMNSCFIIRMIV